MKMQGSHMAEPLGARFVEALAVKDFTRVASLLHPEVDFRAMSPGRFWEANTATQVIEEILRSWFEDSDEVDELLEVDTTVVADCQRVGYRLAASNLEGRFLVEQQAYYETSDGSITWMRVLCSGWRPIAAGLPGMAKETPAIPGPRQHSLSPARRRDRLAAWLPAADVTQASTNCDNTGSGRLPWSRTAAWKSRMSQAAPSRARAWSRSRNISRWPTRYQSVSTNWDRNSGRPSG
jgi:hypothetical protein